MEPKDYYQDSLQSYFHNKYDLSENSDLFSSSSVIDMLNDMLKDYNTDIGTTLKTWKDTINTINDTEDNLDNVPKAVNYIDEADWIAGGEVLMKEHDYKSTQITILHNRHYEKVQYLLHTFYKFQVTEGPEKEKYETYMSNLIFLNTSFKTSVNLVLTKKGMERCNDIYNWYESVKRNVEFIGAPRT
jgi:hypothetical protein